MSETGITFNIWKTTRNGEDILIGIEEEIADGIVAGDTFPYYYIETYDGVNYFYPYAEDLEVSSITSTEDVRSIDYNYEPITLFVAVYNDDNPETISFKSVDKVMLRPGPLSFSDFVAPMLSAWNSISGVAISVYKVTPEEILSTQQYGERMIYMGVENPETCTKENTDIFYMPENNTLYDFDFERVKKEGRGMAVTAVLYPPLQFAEEPTS